MDEAAWYRADGTPGSALRGCLLAATAAPSIFNTQPWLFRAYAGGIDVLADRRRQLATLDPTGREMLVSVGAAIFNLRITVRACGRCVQVRLRPDPREPDLAARVTLGGPAAVDPAVRQLAGAIARRRTNRRPFADRPVPDPVLAELADAAVAEAATLETADPSLREGVLSLARTAENRMRGNPRYRAEVAAWTTPPGRDRRDGVPREAFAPRDRHAALPLRDFAVGHGAATPIVAFEPEPTIIMLSTAGDSTADWLRAGAALQRVLLVATGHGLAATPLTQMLEVPRLRALLEYSATGRVVQTVLRVGYPLTPAPATPRRPLDEVIVAR